MASHKFYFVTGWLTEDLVPDLLDDWLMNFAFI